MVLWSIYNCVEQQLFTIVMEQQSYDRIYMIWITRIGSTWPGVVCYWNTSEVKEGKLKIHCERENCGKPVKQCRLTSQGKNSKQKEERYKNTNEMNDVGIMKK